MANSGEILEKIDKGRISNSLAHLNYYLPCALTKHISFMPWKAWYRRGIFNQYIYIQLFSKFFDKKVDK